MQCANVPHSCSLPLRCAQPNHGVSRHSCASRMLHTSRVPACRMEGRQDMSIRRQVLVIDKGNTHSYTRLHTYVECCLASRRNMNLPRAPHDPLHTARVGCLTA